jgi:hypothetical protein
MSFNPRISSALVLLASLRLIHAQAPDQLELFEKKVRPIFVENCQGCHNEKVKNGGLNLSSAEGLKEAAAGGFFGAAAEPDKAIVLQALSYEGRVKMPPQGKLAAGKVASIREWIGTGAPTPAVESAMGVRAVTTRGVITEADKKFWAFRPISRAIPPTVAAKDWPANDIDRFILANLEKNGLQPAPPAGKNTLLRRATFDLTGLPPTEKEIKDFLSDNSPNAFGKVVDRLLASPRYGERWGRHWLDVMRYADSTGSDEDHRYPHAWRYRDYVVEAFNSDMPYNEFVREQLAGDLLAADEKSGIGYNGIIATGFLALGKKALAQKDLPLKRYDVVDDQIDVTSKAFLGLTVTCARCHDHKFDPIATKDYYSMAAIFASTLSYTKGQDGPPVETPLAPAGEFETFKKQWDALLDVEGKIDKIIDFDREAKRERDKQEALIPGYMLAAYRVYGNSEEPKQVAADAKLDERMLAAWVEYLRVKTRPELAKWHAATDSTRKQVAEEYQAAFHEGAYRYDQDLSWWKTARHSYPAAGKVAGPRPVFHSADGPFFHAVWIEKGPLYRSQEDQIATIKDDGANDDGVKREGQRKKDDKPQEPQTREQKIKSLRELIAQRTELERTAPTKEVPMASAVKEGESEDQRVFLRGDYHNLGDPVQKIPPSILRVSAPALPVATKSGRLELANWIVSPDNPLPSRVMANRIWQGHFGDGIVRTPDNFGRLGDRPSNPELLDYLARQFMENGWSVKKMHRLIMLSKTYQMSAAYDAGKKAKDPEDRLLSHYPKRRLSVEEVRDAFLSIGGDLDLTMGGTLDPGVGTDGETSANRISMNPESTNRRSIYLPLRRSNLPNLYMLFDFGDATSPEGKRSSTIVATQALFVMNSPLVEREAKSLAHTVLTKENKDARRIERAYLDTLDRRPSADEIDAGLTYIQSLRRKWSDFDEEKAWQSFCHVLLASNEFIYIY